MSPIAIGLLVFVGVFGAALLGMLLRAVLPKHHLSPDTKDVVGQALNICRKASLLWAWRSEARSHRNNSTPDCLCLT